MRLNWKRVLAGMAMGGLSFWTGYWSLLYAWRNGLFAPSPWYDFPICMALIFGPGAVWCGYLIFKTYKKAKSGTASGRHILHGVIYLSSMPAGTAIMWGLASMGSGI